MKTKSAASEASARRIAELKANRQIIQVLNEHVDLYSKTSTVESATEYKNGLTDYYTEQKDQSRAAASASATMSGIQTLFTYKGNHLLNRKPLVGVVTYYNATSGKGAKKAQDILAKAPEKTTDNVRLEALLQTKLIGSPNQMEAVLCLLYTSPSPRDQRGSGKAACA